MNHNHWKELHGLLNGIADAYEEQRNSFKVTQDVECNKPRIRVGITIKIGYMFTTFRKCSCHYLTPRSDSTWTDDEDDPGKELKDKGGRYDSFVPCGEMLVVSVTLLESPAFKREGLWEKVAGNHHDGGMCDPARSQMSPMHIDKQLVKALDRSIVFTSTISDYFEASQKLSTDSSLSKRVCTTAFEDSKNKRQKALKNMVSKSRNATKKRKKDSSTATQSYLDNENPNKRQVFKSIFDTQSDDSSIEANEENHCILSRVSKCSLRKKNSNKPKASYSKKISYCNGDRPCKDNRTLTDDLQSQSSLSHLQEECNRSELSEFSASDNIANISYSDNEMRNLKNSQPSIVERNISATSQKLGDNEIEHEQKLSTENKFCQNENGEASSSPEGVFRSYSHRFSKFKDQTTKLQDMIIACSTTNYGNANIGKLKPCSIFSQAAGPVLGISKSQVKEHSSDHSLFHPQVADQSEGEREAKDCGSQDCTQKDHRRRKENEATRLLDSDMSGDLPDLKQLSTTLEVRIPLEHLDTKLSRYGVYQNASDSPKSSAEKKSRKRFVEIKNQKKESGMLFGDSHISKTKAEMNSVDSDQEVASKNVLAPFLEECCIPEHVSPKQKLDHNAYLSSLPECNPITTKHSYVCKKDDRRLDNATPVRRSSRVKEKLKSSVLSRESLSEKNSFSSSISFSTSLELDVATPVKRKSSELKEKFENTLSHDASPKKSLWGNDICSNKCKVKKKDITSKKCKVRKKDISLKKCKVKKKDIASKKNDIRKTHLSKETLKSMKDLEKCRKVIEQLEKQGVSNSVKQEGTNFSQKCDSSVNRKKPPKCKVEMPSVPQNQPKVTDWISSRQNRKKIFQTITESPSKRPTFSRISVTDSKLMPCVKPVVWKQISIGDVFSEIGEVSEGEKNSEISLGAEKNRNSIHEASNMDDLDRTSELMYSSSVHLTLSQEIDFFDTIDNQDNKCSDENDLSYGDTNETHSSFSSVHGRKLKHMCTEVSAANLEKNTVIFHPKESTDTQLWEGGSQKDEDSAFVTHKKYSENPSLQSLIHSYNRLQQMTIEELENRLKEAIPYLKRVAKGKEPSKRHQIFKRGGREIQQMSDELIFGPYTEDQIIYVVDFLSKNFSTVQGLGDESKWRQYIWKVLAPTLLIKIVMDNEEVTQDNAEKLLIEFSLNRRIRGSTSPSPI
ncbi:uncharacterized protein [Panulirus ornatus]